MTRLSRCPWLERVPLLHEPGQLSHLGFVKPSCNFTQKGGEGTRILLGLQPVHRLRVTLLYLLTNTVLCQRCEASSRLPSTWKHVDPVWIRAKKKAPKSQTHKLCFLYIVMLVCTSRTCKLGSASYDVISKYQVPMHQWKYSDFLHCHGAG